MPSGPVNPSIIGNAPTTPSNSGGGGGANKSDEMIADLSVKLEAAEAEVVRLKGERTVETVKAEMMKPYANRVFWFVVWYCIAVGCIIVVTGFGYVGLNHESFKLSDTVLSIIAGSTAASVIGLIGIVVSGLFGGSKS